MTKPSPIGTACRNMQILLLGEDGQPVEPGQPGEICVRGTGVCQRLLRRPGKV